jgi:hypothetical protein
MKNQSFNINEQQNANIVFNRAVQLFIDRNCQKPTIGQRNRFRMIAYLDIWKKQGKWFKAKREEQGQTTVEVATSINTSELKIRKLENGIDFENRDVKSIALDTYYLMFNKYSGNQ